MRQKLTVMIGDADPSSAARIEQWLGAMDFVRTLGRHDDARPMGAAIAQSRPDLAIVQATLPPLGAFALAGAIDLPIRPRMIVISADAEDAVRAFDVRAFDFIRKPVCEERFSDALVRAHSALLCDREDRQMSRRIAVRHGTRTLLLKLDDIDWIEAAGNYVRIHSGSKSWLLRETMTGIERKFPPHQFVRIQRSVIVNLERVDALRNGRKDDLTVLLSDATELPLSRTYRENFEIALGM